MLGTDLGHVRVHANTRLPPSQPIDLPRLVASSSFVGGGIIESNVYTGANTQWYFNTGNFLRSVRNFIIDIRAGSQTAQICGIHW